MKPIIIGQAPVRIPTAKAFDKHSGERLLSMMGLKSMTHLHHLFECRNLMDWYPIRYRFSDTIPAKAARLAGRNAIADFHGRTVLVLGRTIANHLGLEWAEYLRWTCVYGGNVALSPHPAASSKFWRQPEAVMGVKEFLHRFADTAQHEKEKQNV